MVINRNCHRYLFFCW